MSKEVDAKGQVWFETAGTRTRLGLTRNFLSTVMEECWHIIPAYRERVVKGAPLLTIETNDSLISVLSPVSGRVRAWEQRACDFPDQLSEDDVLIEVDDGKSEAPAPPSEEERVAARNRLIDAGVLQPITTSAVERQIRAFIADPNTAQEWVADIPIPPRGRARDILDELGVEPLINRNALITHFQGYREAELPRAVERQITNGTIRRIVR